MSIGRASKASSIVINNERIKRINKSNERARRARRRARGLVAGWAGEIAEAPVPMKSSSGKDVKKSKATVPMKRRSGKSKSSSAYKKGVERKPLLRKSKFSPQCVAQLAHHFFSPEKDGFIPDGRWTVETRQNGKFLYFTAFHVSFD